MNSMNSINQDAARSQCFPNRAAEVEVFISTAESAEYNAMLWWIPLLESCLYTLDFYTSQDGRNAEDGVLPQIS